MGMLTSAVQHSRDGLGKRSKEPHTTSQQQQLSETNYLKLLSSSPNDTPPEMKIPKPVLSSIGEVMMGANKGPTASPGLYTTSQGTTIVAISPPPPSITGLTTSAAGNGAMGYLTDAGGLGASTYVVSSNFGNLVAQHNPATTINNNHSNSFAATSAFTPLQQPYHHQAAAALLLTSPTSTVPTDLTGGGGGGLSSMKCLSRMLEGYHHFVSLRKASYTLVEGLPYFKNSDEIPQSNFGTSKKICKIEASLIMDTVEKFFTPFESLSTDEKVTTIDTQ